jgi:hypothetical protein
MTNRTGCTTLLREGNMVYEVFPAIFTANVAENMLFFCNIFVDANLFG